MPTPRTNLNCSQAEPLLSAFVDGELAAFEEQRVSGHLAQCAACAQVVHDLQALQTTLGSERVYYQAPERLHSKMKAAMAGGAVRSALYEPLTVKSLIIVLTVIAVLGSTIGVGWWWYNQPLPSLAELSVRGHMRSIADHRQTEVASGDPRTVADWMRNKTGRGIKVWDLSAHQYVLAGARLDRTVLGVVPVVVYSREAQLISVYHWPTQCEGALHPCSKMGTGCHVLNMSDGQGIYLAVSDLPAANLEEFAGLIRGKASAQK